MTDDYQVVCQAADDFCAKVRRYDCNRRAEEMPGPNVVPDRDRVAASRADDTSAILMAYAQLVEAIENASPPMAERDGPFFPPFRRTWALPFARRAGPAMTDAYQRRYEDHRRRKEELLTEVGERLAWGDDLDVKLIHVRRSVRVFTSVPLAPSAWEMICAAAQDAPQSCNRQALKLKVVTGTVVGELLAGGEGWLSGAPTVVLIFADMGAYKSPVERDYMPRLDAGVMMMAIVQAATVCGVGSCIVNPHIRQSSVNAFTEAFNLECRLFCGAVALGYAAIIPDCPEKKPLEELVEWL